MCADSLENRHSEAKFSALLPFCKQLERIRITRGLSVCLIGIRLFGLSGPKPGLFFVIRPSWFGGIFRSPTTVPCLVPKECRIAGHYQNYHTSGPIRLCNFDQIYFLAIC